MWNPFRKVVISEYAKQQVREAVEDSIKRELPKLKKELSIKSENLAKQLKVKADGWKAKMGNDPFRVFRAIATFFFIMVFCSVIICGLVAFWLSSEATKWAYEILWDFLVSAIPWVASVMMVWLGGDTSIISNTMSSFRKK